MKSLSARKEELLMACDIQRQMLRLEWSVIQVHVHRIQGACQRIPRAWKWLTPVVGFLLARRSRRGSRSAGWATAKWVILYQLWEGWRRWRKRSA